MWVIEVPGGVLCILGGAALLWWNEANAYDKSQMIRALRERVLSVDGLSLLHYSLSLLCLTMASGLLPENDGEVVHFTGELRTKQAQLAHC